MPKYPLKLYPVHLRDRTMKTKYDPALQSDYARLIEEHINTAIQDSEPGSTMVFTHAQIAHRLNIPVEIVEALLRPHHGGDRGITVLR